MPDNPMAKPPGEQTKDRCPSCGSTDFNSCQRERCGWFEAVIKERIP